MKKLLVILFSAGLALGASAQRTHFAGGGHVGVVYQPRIVVGTGFGLGFGYGFGPYWGYPGFYGPWGYPYPPYYYGQGSMPTRLAVQVNDIKSDYQAQIKSTRHDKTIPRKERRERIKQLKIDRDQAVIQARKDYFNNSRRNYNNRNYNNGNGNNNNNGPQGYNNNNNNNNNSKSNGSPNSNQPSNQPNNGNDQ
jgi:hypothetical protein